MTADRSPDDVHLPYSISSFHYNFDLYDGNLTKTFLIVPHVSISLGAGQLWVHICSRERNEC